MHGFEDRPPSSLAPHAGGPWYKELNRYHWFVLIVAALGWLFDCLDQQLFILARADAMRDLLATSPGQVITQQQITSASTDATAIFLMGWAIGGLVFGVVGDKIGRARTMLLTILLYSMFTGLSAFAVSFWDFALYRFLTGLGVGGEFAVGVALVAEVMPDRARPFALGLLQALSAIGNVSAAFVSWGLGSLQSASMLEGLEFFGTPMTAWRLMFVVGIAPALLAIVIRLKLREPERWEHTAHEGAQKKLGSYAELFGDPMLRKRALVGLMLAFSGVVGLWGVGFFTFDLLGAVMRLDFEGKGMSADQIDGEVAKWKGICSLMFNAGAFLGIYGFTMLTHRLGRKPVFTIFFVAAFVSTITVFWSLDKFSEIFWMVPIMGFCQLALFGGYAIYFPELFPTRLRSTGTSFCYNVGRFVAAVGPYGLGILTSQVYAHHEGTLPFRYAGMTMCGIFLLGLLVLPFAPETKDQPLPD